MGQVVPALCRAGSTSFLCICRVAAFCEICFLFFYF